MWGQIMGSLVVRCKGFGSPGKVGRREDLRQRPEGTPGGALSMGVARSGLCLRTVIIGHKVMRGAGGSPGEAAELHRHPLLHPPLCLSIHQAARLQLLVCSSICPKGSGDLQAACHLPTCSASRDPAVASPAPSVYLQPQHLRPRSCSSRDVV